MVVVFWQILTDFVHIHVGIVSCQKLNYEWIKNAILNKKKLLACQWQRHLESGRHIEILTKMESR